jgi:hypothetical protein
MNKSFSKKLLALLLVGSSCVASAGSLYTTPYKSVNDANNKNLYKDGERANTKIVGLEENINQIRDAIRQIESDDGLTDDNKINFINGVLSRFNGGKSLPTNPQKRKDALAEVLGNKEFEMELAQLTKLDLEKGCRAGEFCKIVFSEDEVGFGDITLNPFNEGTDYKINALNYSVYLGDEKFVPFQLYFGEVSQEGDTKEANTKSIMDPTQGIAVQVPWLYRWGGQKTGGFCNFEVKDGHCIGGGDLTFRYLELEEKDAATGKSNSKGLFGFSAGLGMSFMFPIFQDQETGEAGHVSIAAKARMYYHNHDDPTLLFGAINDPNGNPVKFEKWFGAFSLSGEFAINDTFTAKFDYFRPWNNEEHMDEVFKVSFMLHKF